MSASGVRTAQERDRFLTSDPGAAGGESGPTPVRRPILASWARCRELRMDPGASDLPYLSATELDPEHRLLRAAGPVLDRLHTALSGSRVSVLLTDESGRVRARRAGEHSLHRHLDAVQLAPGFSYAEDHAGTNGIGTALTERQPFTVLSGEHFSERLQDFACAGAPVRDPLSGLILGVLDLTCWQADRHPMMMRMVLDAVAAIEQRLFEQCSQREQLLLERLLTDRQNSTPLPHDADLPADDRAALEEAAAGMLAAGHSAVLQVPLADGSAAVLRCRPAEEGAPERMVVRARLLPARLHPSSSDTVLLLGNTTAGGLALAARRRLTLLCEAGARIGTTLDVQRTARELAAVAVPALAQEATVDLWEWVLDGGEPPATEGCPTEALRRTAARTIRESPAVLAPPPGPLTGHQPVLRTDADGSRIDVPIVARGTVLGLAAFLRGPEREPFQADDLALLGELVGRAAVSLDNAHRYTRERALALSLQQSLLPGVLPELNAVEVAHRYLPTSAAAGVGGDWYDVIPLSGGRVALVVGDVVGHGLHAAAAMGRLRTAVRNFSTLDLPPEELLGQLDAMADTVDREQPESPSGAGVVGATCLYVVHDPVSGLCTMATAGHPAPALLTPDGAITFPELPAGPPLGLGGSPFETAEFTLPEGSTLLLYTDGLIEDRTPGTTVDDGLSRLRSALGSLAPASPQELCRELPHRLLPAQPRDDVALLAARTRRTDAEHVATWDVPLDPAAVAAVRSAAARRLLDWGLGEAAFTTELMVSELVTNAIRHAAGPVQLRLLRDRTLICEVTDTSSTSPRLRRARSTDEGGRGLYLVAQLAHRWGTRYTPTGKVIWAEQPLGPISPISPG